MQSRNRHALSAFVVQSFFFVSALAALGCASSATARPLEPRNVAGTAHVPHTEPQRVREATALVEHGSASSGRALGVTRRARAR